MFRVALKLAGQSAEVVMALGDLLPEPPAGAGLVVVVAEPGLVVEVLLALLLDPPPKMAYEMPNTTAATMTTTMMRRVLDLRFCAFCSAASRACRPAF